MTQLNTDFSQARTLSLLTEKPCFINNTYKHVAFSGYILPYSTFNVIFMWALCGRRIYNKLLIEQDLNIQLCKTLNPFDSTLQSLENNRIGMYLSDKFKESLRKFEPDEIEEMLNDMEYI